MKKSIESKFKADYQQHCKHLKLKGLQPKTIEAYSRAIRRIGAYFNYGLDNLTHDKLLDYFHQLKESSSWSTVKLDLYGLKFFYTYVLNKNWVDIGVLCPTPRKGKASIADRHLPIAYFPQSGQFLFDILM